MNTQTTYGINPYSQQAMKCRRKPVGRRVSEQVVGGEGTKATKPKSFVDALST